MNFRRVEEIIHDDEDNDYSSEASPKKRPRRESSSLKPSDRISRSSKRPAVSNDAPTGDALGLSTRRKLRRRATPAQEIQGHDDASNKTHDPEQLLLNVITEADFDTEDEERQPKRTVSEATKLIDEFWRTQRSHLRAIDGTGLTSVSKADKRKPSSHRVLQLGDSTRDESLRGTADEFARANTTLAAELEYVLTSYEIYAKQPPEERGFFNDFQAKKLLERDVQGHVAFALAGMTDNTKLALCRPDFGLKDFDDMTPVSEQQLDDEVVYVIGIEYHDAPDRMYLGSVTREAFELLFDEYDWPLQDAAIGLFHRSLGRERAAKHACAANVKAVHSRIVWSSPMPRPRTSMPTCDKISIALKGHIWIFSGLSCWALRAMRRASTVSTIIKLRCTSSLCVRGRHVAFALHKG
jgi:hypothetical protein